MNNRYLYRNPVVGRYTADRSALYPCVATADGAQLMSRGGFRIGGGKVTARPGRGDAFGGNGFDRYAIAVYHVKLAGAYAIVASSVRSTAGNGGEVLVYVSGSISSPLMSAPIPSNGASVQFDTPPRTLNPGEAIYVCRGPNGDEATDEVEVDFNV